MVQVLPQATNLGSILGSALGQGFGESATKYADIAQQRGLLQNALKQVEQTAQGGNPLQTILATLQAGAGIPGFERYAKDLLPMILQQATAKNIYGNQGQVPGVAGSSGIPPQSGAPGSQGEGIVPRVKTPAELDTEARRAALITGNPQAYTQRLGELTAVNQLSQSSRDAASQRAAELGVPPEDVPTFLRLGEKHNDSKDLDTYVRDTYKDWKLYKSSVENLRNTFIPGFWHGLVSSPKDREKSLARLEPYVKNLKELGAEPEIRDILADEGLSPTEVEELVHPLSPETKKELAQFKQFPRYLVESVDRQPKLKNQFDKDLVSLFKKTITPDTSLSSMRHFLSIERGVPWEMIGPAIRQAVESGKIELTPAQQNEMAEIEGQPPRQSLSHIFMNWKRPIEYLTRKK